MPMPQLGAHPLSSDLPVYHSAGEVIGALRPTEPVYCLYRNVALRTAQAFLRGFPGDTLYAVKANPAPQLLDLLYEAGVRHFDTASIAEIRLIKQRFPDARCYYMAPVRMLGTAGEAYRTWGVRDFVLDSTEELDKILDETRARDLTLYVRLKADVGGAVLELSSKFGTSDIYAAHLLQRINSIGLKPALAFHVGSQCTDPDAYYRALEICGQVIAVAGVELAALDVGGGFPAPYEGVHMADISAYFDAVRTGVGAIDLARNARILCEPGRGLAAYGISLITQVIGRRGDRIYLNDGIYGSFSEMSIPNSRIIYPSRVSRLDGDNLSRVEGDLMPFIVYGPTCDTLDRLPHLLDLPTDIQLGDYIEFGLMGAYTNANRTEFNGFFPNAFVEIADPAATPPGLEG